MDQSKNPLPALLAVAALGFVLLAGCTPDELNQRLPTGDGLEPGDTDPGPDPYPVATGTELSYIFTRRYLKDHAALPPGGGSTSVDETKSAGQLCLRVQSVDDNLESNTASDLTARVRVAGDSAGEDLFFGRLDANGDPDPTVTVGDVDAATDDLWLWQVTFPTRGHNLLTPTTVSFGTRGPISPDGQLATTLFFDPRPSPNGAWAGWLDPGVTAGADSIITQLQSYLVATEGLSLFDPAQVKIAATELRPSCSGHGSESACLSNTCLWDTGACRSPNATLSVVWRDSISDGPAELEGAVIRSISWEFGSDGVLAAAQEYIIKDMTGTGSLTPFQTCAPTQPFNYSSGPCATAVWLRQQVGFTNSTCAFQ